MKKAVFSANSSQWLHIQMKNNTQKTNKQNQKHESKHRHVAQNSGSNEQFYPDHKLLALVLRSAAGLP